MSERGEDDVSVFPGGVWRYPTGIRFGVGEIAELPSAVKAAGIARPLVVTDNGLAGHAMIADARARLQAAGLPTALFSRVRGNPVGADIEAGMTAFRDGDHDGVVAIGGGSALDAGKTIAMAARQPRALFDLHVSAGGPAAIDGSRVAPMVAVPTTAGTGSETGRAAVVTDERVHEKRIFLHATMMPRVVIEDPQLTVGLPANLTAWTGMDALAHCFEGLCAPELHPFSDGVAVEGLRVIKEFLPRAVLDGSDLEARGMMLAAASMGSTAFQKGLGAIHSLSHPVGARYDTHHGLTNAVFFPYVIVHNRASIHEKCDRLAAYLALPKGGVDGVLDWILDLRERFHIPHTLAELGVDDARVDEIAAAAEKDPSTESNPMPVFAADMKAMFLAALEGRVG